MSDERKIMYLEAIQTIAVLVALVGGLLWHWAQVSRNHEAILDAEARIEAKVDANSRRITLLVDPQPAPTPTSRTPAPGADDLR